MRYLDFDKICLCLFQKPLARVYSNESRCIATASSVFLYINKKNDIRNFSYLLQKQALS